MQIAFHAQGSESIAVRGKRDTGHIDEVAKEVTDLAPSVDIEEIRIPSPGQRLRSVWGKSHDRRFNAEVNIGIFLKCAYALPGRDLPQTRVHIACRISQDPLSDGHQVPAIRREGDGIDMPGMSVQLSQQAIGLEIPDFRRCVYDSHSV